MRAKVVIALLAITALVVACERVVDLTPPDAATAVPDAAISGDQDAAPPGGDAGVDGNDATPPDASVDAS